MFKRFVQKICRILTGTHSQTQAQQPADKMLNKPPKLQKAVELDAPRTEPTFPTESQIESRPNLPPTADAFKKREYAQEEMYIRERERELLENLKKKE